MFWSFMFSGSVRGGVHDAVRVLVIILLLYIFFVDLFRIRKRTLGGSGSYMWAPSPLGTLLLLA